VATEWRKKCGYTRLVIYASAAVSLITCWMRRGEYCVCGTVSNRYPGEPRDYMRAGFESFDGHGAPRYLGDIVGLIVGAVARAGLRLLWFGLRRHQGMGTSRTASAGMGAPVRSNWSRLLTMARTKLSVSR
jgi:hypothetical protein